MSDAFYPRLARSLRCCLAGVFSIALLTATAYAQESSLPGFIRPPGSTPITDQPPVYEAQPPSEGFAPKLPPNPNTAQPSPALTPPVQGVRLAPQIPADLLPVQPSTEPNTVTLTEPPETPERTMLQTILQAGVTKTSEYPIDLETVLKLVEDQNLPIERDVLNTKIQKTTFYRRMSEFLPDIDATYSQSRFQGTIQIFGNQTVDVYQTRYNPQLRAQLTVFPGGQTVFESLAARRRYNGSRYQLENTLQSQLTQASREYYLLLEAQVQVQNVLIAIDEARSLVKLNESRYAAGVGTKLDVMRSRSQLVDQERNLIDAETVLQRAEQNLINRLNLEPEIHLRPLTTSAQPKLLVPLSLSSETLVNIAEKNEPSLKALAKEIQAQQADFYAIMSRFVPSVTLETYVNGTGPALDNLGLGRFGGFTISSNLLENLGTAIPLDLRTKHLQIKQARVDYKTQLRNVQSQVVEAFINSRNAAKAILAGEEQYNVSQEAYRLAVGRYQAGLGIYLDVLDAETALNEARTQLNRAILVFNRAQVDLVDAIGEASIHSLTTGLMEDKVKQYVKTPAP